MSNMIKILNTIVFLSVALFGSSTLPAATFSSTKVELLYGFDYERESQDQFLLTLANATGFTYGDSYFFLDVGDFDDEDQTDGIHMEWGPRLSLLRTFGSGQWDGIVKDIYIIGQLDFDANRFTTRVTKMLGLSLDWDLFGARFIKTHLQFRDDPQSNARGSSVQFNLVWNKGFNIGNQKFSFEGFLDWTTSEGSIRSNLLTQPQLIWHATDNIGLGIEYQYWHNRLGRAGVDESTPQLLLRWTF